jgi:hypothetical protein
LYTPIAVECEAASSQKYTYLFAALMAVRGEISDEIKQDYSSWYTCFVETCY